MDKAQYPHQDLAQQIADYWASPDEANQMLAFAFLKSQTLCWVEKDCKELINTALCLCWDKPELLEFLDFDKRKNAVISNVDNVLCQSKESENLCMIIASDLNSHSKKSIVKSRIRIGFFTFKSDFCPNDTEKRDGIIRSGKELEQRISEFKAYLPEFLGKENTLVEFCVTINTIIIKDFHYFLEGDYPDLIDWRSPSKFAPYFTEFIYNNLDKLTE